MTDLKTDNVETMIRDLKQAPSPQPSPSPARATAMAATTTTRRGERQRSKSPKYSILVHGSNQQKQQLRLQQQQQQRKIQEQYNQQQQQRQKRHLQMQQQQQKEQERQQEIIFRFTIPRATNSSNNNNNKINEDDTFVVSALGQEFQVEYPDSTIGVRRESAWKLGYITVPTYYKPPKIMRVQKFKKIIQNSSNDADCNNRTSDNGCEIVYYYTVQIPKEIFPGEEFYVNINHPEHQHDENNKNDHQKEMLATYGSGIGMRSSLFRNHPMPQQQCRLVCPLYHDGTMEFEAPPASSFYANLGFPLKWKLVERSNTTFQIQLPQSQSSSQSSSSSSPPPRQHHHTPCKQCNFLTFLGRTCIPVIARRRRRRQSQSPPRPSSTIQQKQQQRNRKEQDIDVDNEDRITFSLPIPSICLGGRKLKISSFQEGWHRLYHVVDEALVWVYLRSDGSLVTTPPPAFCTVPKEDGASLDWIPATRAKMDPYIRSLDRKTVMTGEYQVIGSYWDTCAWRFLPTNDKHASRRRKEAISSWLLKLQLSEGIVVIPMEYWYDASRTSSSTPMSIATNHEKHIGTSFVQQALEGTTQLKGKLVRHQWQIEWRMQAIGTPSTSASTSTSMTSHTSPSEVTAVAEATAVTTTPTASSSSSTVGGGSSISSSSSNGPPTTIPSSKHFFQLLVDEILSDETLWVPTPNNPDRYEISTKSDNDERRKIFTTKKLSSSKSLLSSTADGNFRHRLQTFRLFGRVIGKALLDRRKIFISPSSDANNTDTDDQKKYKNLAKYLYKHLLQWPINQSDWEETDKKHFTTTMDHVEKNFASTSTSSTSSSSPSSSSKSSSSLMLVTADGKHELVPGGQFIPASSTNEYVEISLCHRFYASIQQPLTEWYCGILEIVPKSFFLVFHSTKEIEEWLTMYD